MLGVEGGGGGEVGEMFPRHSKIEASTVLSPIVCNSKLVFAKITAVVLNRPFYRYGGHLEFYCFD